MKKKKSGVMEVGPSEIGKYLSKEELREERELAEFSKKIKTEQEIGKQKKLVRQKKKAVKLAKESEDCFLHLTPTYDGPFRAQSGKRANWDFSKAPDYTGEGSDIDLVNSYV